MVRVPQGPVAWLYIYILYIYIYIYIYIYPRLGGKKLQVSPIGKSVSVSFRVRVVRACVRSCLSAGGRCSSTLEARMGRSSTPAWGELFVYLLLYAWVLRKKTAEAEESCGFFEYSFVFCNRLI